MGVIVVGSLNMDLIISTNRWPSTGETVLGKDFVQLPGGKGANQAVAAAAAGAKVTMVGRVGQDTFGIRLLANLKEHGVNADAVIVDEQANTGLAMVGIDGEGENRIVVIPGANGCLTAQDVHHSRQAGVWVGKKVCLLQLEIPLEAAVAAAHIAHEQGITVILDPAPAMRLPDELLRSTDICMPNVQELSLLTGHSVENIAEARLAASALLRQGVGAVLVKLGANGALLVDGNHIQHFPAYLVKVVDTTGAGDAFAGAVAAALAEGQPLEAAASMGNLAGALACTRKGAQSALPTRTEMDKLAQQSSF